MEDMKSLSPSATFFFAYMFSDSGTSVHLLSSFAAYHSFVGMFRTILLPKQCPVSCEGAGQKVEVTSRKVRSSGSYISIRYYILTHQTSPNEIPHRADWLNIKLCL